MAEKKVALSTETNVGAEPYIAKEDFITKYSKPLFYGAGALILLIGAWFGYQKLVKEPKEQKASEIIFPAESMFDKMALAGFNADSVNIILNGGTVEGSKVTGLLNVMKTYSGTPAANRAAYMAGAAYLQTKDFNNAVKYLKTFNPHDAYQTEIKKYMMLGHAYAEQNKKDDALNAYKKAATINEKDEVFTLDALMTAGAYAEFIGKPKDAIDLYQKAKDNYPASQGVQNGDVDKYLGRLGITK